MRASVFGFGGPGAARVDSMRRALQSAYLDTLIALYASPDAAAPSDARALAYAELEWLQRDARRAATGAVDETTRAHLELLAARAQDALKPRK
jgi:hypothetical protein